MNTTSKYTISFYYSQNENHRITERFTSIKCHHLEKWFLDLYNERHDKNNQLNQLKNKLIPLHPGNLEILNTILNSRNTQDYPLFYNKGDNWDLLWENYLCYALDAVTTAIRYTRENLFISIKIH